VGDREPQHAFVDLVPDDLLHETSTERFDRVAFAERAVALLRPSGTTVAICPGALRVRVEAGREWRGAQGARWAILRVSPHASRRAIAVAVAAIAGAEPTPWALDVLLATVGAAPYR